MNGFIIGFYFLFWWCLATFSLLLLVFGCYFVLIFGVRRSTWGHKSVMCFDGFNNVRMLLNWGFIVQYLVLFNFVMLSAGSEAQVLACLFVLLKAHLLKPTMVEGLAQGLFIWISNILARLTYLEPNHKPIYVNFSGFRILFLSAAQFSFGLVFCDLGCVYTAQFWASKQAQLLFSRGLYFSCCCRMTVKAQTWVLLYIWWTGCILFTSFSFELKDGIGSQLDQDALNLVLICNRLVYLGIANVWSYTLLLGKHIIPTSRLEASRRCMFSELANTKACFGISLVGWRGYAPLNM